uniref:Uncharacterized protein n=1 Tax=Escherichia coli TaxID=562 RepID=A0A5S9GG06_ECOLX|nr:hypothetical protein [Escherichia coli]
MENRKPKARYIVGIPHGRVLYEGNLRFAAWWSGSVRGQFALCSLVVLVVQLSPGCSI